MLDYGSNDALIKTLRVITKLALTGNDSFVQTFYEQRSPFAFEKPFTKYFFCHKLDSNLD